MCNKHELGLSMFSAEFSTFSATIFQLHALTIPERLTTFLGVETNVAEDLFVPSGTLVDAFAYYKARSGLATFSGWTSRKEWFALQRIGTVQWREPVSSVTLYVEVISLLLQLPLAKISLRTSLLMANWCHPFSLTKHCLKGRCRKNCHNFQCSAWKRLKRF